MNRKELLKLMSAKTGLTQKQCKSMLGAFTDTIQDSLKNQENVKIINFGVFETRQRAARKCFNPKTREPIQVPAKIVPAFRPASKLKRLVNDIQSQILNYIKMPTTLENEPAPDTTIYDPTIQNPDIQAQL